jgi:hypothetical protein
MRVRGTNPIIRMMVSKVEPLPIMEIQNNAKKRIAFRIKGMTNNLFILKWVFTGI